MSYTKVLCLPGGFTAKVGRSCSTQLVMSLYSTQATVTPYPSLTILDRLVLIVTLGTSCSLVEEDREVRGWGTSNVANYFPKEDYILGAEPSSVEDSRFYLSW